MACSLLKAVGAGFAGALVLTVLHRSSRPKVSPEQDELPGVRFASDLIANTALFSLVGAVGRENAVLTGSFLGLGAGLGSAFLPKPEVCDDPPVSRSMATQAMTIGLYVAGGMMAAAAYKKLR